MENYNRLFLLEDPTFDMEAFMSPEYKGKPEEGKANLNQITDAWLGESFLTEDFIKHMVMPKYNADGSYELVSGDIFFDHIQKGDQVKDERDDATSEVKEEETNLRLENAIDAISITPPAVPVELYEATQFTSANYDGSDAYVHRVGNSDDLVTFKFGIALPEDAAEMVAAQNGISLDRIEMEFNPELGVATGLKVVDAEGSDVTLEEGSVITAFAPNYSPEEGIKSIKNAIQALEESKAAAIEGFGQFDKDNKEAIDGANTSKADAEVEVADRTKLIADLGKKLEDNKAALSASGNSNEIGESKEKCLVIVGELYSAKGLLSVSEANVKGFTKAIADLAAAGTEGKLTHDKEIAAAEEAIRLSKENVERLEEIRRSTNLEGDK
jgi:nucleoid DNA-binding protein